MVDTLINAPDAWSIWLNVMLPPANRTKAWRGFTQFCQWNNYYWESQAHCIGMAQVGDATLIGIDPVTDVGYFALLSGVALWRESTLSTSCTAGGQPSINGMNPAGSVSINIVDGGSGTIPLTGLAAIPHPGAAVVAARRVCTTAGIAGQWIAYKAGDCVGALTMESIRAALGVGSWVACPAIGIENINLHIGTFAIPQGGGPW